jgi:hypothetical protein
MTEVTNLISNLTLIRNKITMMVVSPCNILATSLAHACSSYLLIIFVERGKMIIIDEHNNAVTVIIIHQYNKKKTMHVLCQ